MKQFLKIVNITFKNLSKKSLFTLIFIQLIMILGTLPFPILQKHLMNSLVQKDSSKLKYLIYLILISVFIQISTSITFTIYQAIIKEKNIYKIREDLLKKVFKIEYCKLQNINSQYLLNKIYTDTVIIQDYVFAVFFNIIVSLVPTVFSIIYIFRMSRSLLIAISLIIILNLFFYILYRKKIFSTTLNYKESSNILYSKISETFSNIETTKINNLEENELNKHNFAFKTILVHFTKMITVKGIYNSIVSSTQLIITVLILLICSYQVVNNIITIGDLFAISAFSQYITSPLYKIFDIISQYQSVLSSYIRIDEILSEKEELSGKFEINKIDLIDIDIKKFKLNNKLILKNIEFNFKKGNLYVIQGSNGAGKSSFIKILLKLYSYYEGSIHINKKDLKSLKNTSIRKHISVIEQTPKIFNDTILNNIFYGVDNYDIDNLTEHPYYSFINSLLENFKSFPDGLNTILNSSNLLNISGGEFQKINIIRCLLKNSDVIILDEPTNALDKHSINSLVDFLLSIKDSKIIIIISHLNIFNNIANEVIHISRV